MTAPAGGLGQKVQGRPREKDGDPVFLAKSSRETGYVTERFASVAFTKTKERG